MKIIKDSNDKKTMKIKEENAIFFSFSLFLNYSLYHWLLVDVLSEIEVRKDSQQHLDFLVSEFITGEERVSNLCAESIIITKIMVYY